MNIESSSGTGDFEEDPCFSTSFDEAAARGRGRGRGFGFWPVADMRVKGQNQSLVVLLRNCCRTVRDVTDPRL